MQLKNTGPSAPRSGHAGSHANRPLAPAAILDALPVPGSDEVLVCPLGGVDEIGMNWTLYGHAGSWILVDAGSSFPPRDVEGVEAVFPDPRVLRSLKGRLAALVVTHFHEDHVGAIHRLWPDVVDCPIHATPFAKAMLAEKFRMSNQGGKPTYKVFEPGSAFNVGPFSIQTLDVGHSTPESVALSIRTRAGNILHTGDWKLDPAPGIGRPTDLSRFRALGDRGVDLMLCDSTNADRERPASSEAWVRTAFEQAFAEASGMVVVASFGSNVARMASVAYAAAATGRRVALAGSSLKRSYKAASKLGMLAGVPDLLIDARRLEAYDRRQCVLLCTGTQGEERAALTKLSERHPDLPKVKAGDTVIHSARAIPGNEDYLYPVLSRLEAMGARVITADTWRGDTPIHVSGHPSRPELRAMYDAVRPKAAIPVHGTAHHLEAHAELAASIGVDRVEIPSDGSLLRLGRDGLTRLGRLRPRFVAVLGDREGTIVPWDAVRGEAALDAPLWPAQRQPERPGGSRSRVEVARPQAARVEVARNPRGDRDRRDPRRHPAPSFVPTPVAAVPARRTAPPLAAAPPMKAPPRRAPPPRVPVPAASTAVRANVPTDGMMLPASLLRPVPPARPPRRETVVEVEEAFSPSM